MKKSLLTTALFALLLLSGGVARGQDLFNTSPQSALSFGDEKVSVCHQLTLADSVGFYKFSVGLNINTFGGGPSIKYGISKNCVFQTDLASRLFINHTSSDWSGFVIYMHEISQNFLFQQKFSEKRGVSYYYMCGGGLSGGVSVFRPYIWKIGTYPFFGLEFALKRQKLSFQIDIRPGYGLLLKSANAKPSRDYPLRTFFAMVFYMNPPEQYPYHGYNISVNFAVRFCKLK